MTTDIGEIPLINMANVMLSTLKAAAEREVTAADCVGRLMRQLARIHEQAGNQRSELEGRVALALDELASAGLLQATAAGRYRITGRGLTVLQEHPMGVDETVLAEFREFRDVLKRFAVPPEECEAMGLATPPAQAYLEGYGAAMAGRPVTDNPHPLDTIEHTAWDAGWFEALDEVIENQGDRPGRE